jgi:hypothetical protein
MREPVRLAEESESELESALLGAGASYHSSARARANTLAALGLAGSAVATGAASAASLRVLAKLASKVSSNLSWIKVVGAVSLAGIAVVPVGYYASHRRQPVPEVVVAGRAADTVPVAPPADPQVPVRTLAAPARSATASLNSPSRAIGRDGTRRDPRVAGTRGTLAEELVTLDAARAAFSQGDAPGALSLLDTYGRAYPHGELALEAEVLRIDALALSGRAGLARKRAAVFLRSHPNSVLAGRVRAHHDP